MVPVEAACGAAAVDVARQCRGVVQVLCAVVAVVAVAAVAAVVAASAGTSPAAVIIVRMRTAVMVVLVFLGPRMTLGTTRTADQRKKAVQAQLENQKMLILQRWMAILLHDKGQKWISTV